MNNRGPIITLLAVAALAVVLLVLNTTVTIQTAATPAPAGQAPAAEAPAAEAPAAEAPGAEAPGAEAPGAEAPGAEAPGAVPPAPPEAAQAPPGAPATPPADPQQQHATYAGRTSGNEATIAIAVQDGLAAAYLCDGRRVEAWLQGTITDGQLTVQGAEGSRATGSVEGNAMFGTVWVNDRQWPYSAQLASPPAGLYQGNATVNGVPTRFGWILLPDGSQTGLGKSRDGVRPAPLLNPTAPGAVVVDGSRVSVAPQPVEGKTQVVLSRPPS